jgi:hypothetical protein
MPCYLTLDEIEFALKLEWTTRAFNSPFVADGNSCP